MSFIDHPDRLLPAIDPMPELLEPTPSLWRRLLDRIADRRDLDRNRAAEDLIARSGGRLTDDLERQIALHW